MRFLLVIFLIAVFSACSSSQIDPSALTVTPEDRETIYLPDGCENIYDFRNYTVAVVEFKNNTTYKDADVSSSRGSSSSVYGVGAGVGAGRGGVGVGLVAGNEKFSSYDSISKYLQPQLGEFAQGAVESNLVALGGVNVVARSHMEQILTEQQFQMTIADPDTAVEFGRLSGAEFIITGSVDNIKVSYTSSVGSGNTNSGSIASVIFSLSVAVYNAVSAGWNVEAEITVNVIDVATGKILSTKRAKGDTNIGDTPLFTYDQVIAGAKSAMGDAVKKSMEMMGEQFEVKGYINEMRGNKKVVLVSLGSDHGLRAGDKFRPFEMTVQTDFRTNARKCITTPLNYTLTVNSHLGNDYAWMEVDSTNAAQLAKLKVGTVVKRVSVKR